MLPDPWLPLAAPELPQLYLPLQHPPGLALPCQHESGSTATATPAAAQPCCSTNRSGTRQPVRTLLQVVKKKPTLACKEYLTAVCHRSEVTPRYNAAAGPSTCTGLREVERAKAQQSCCRILSIVWVRSPSQFSGFLVLFFFNPSFHVPH